MTLNANKPFLDVVTRNGVNWKLIPGYVATYASEEGEIALLLQTGILHRVPVVKWHNTHVSKRNENTYYLHAKVIDESYNIEKRAVHQLVCLAYHGFPPADGRRYEPNHINAVKTDNRPSNLEWVTRSKNIEHLYQQGLHAGGIGIIARNVNTDEVIRHSSVSALSRLVGISRWEVREFIYKHGTEPYNGWVYSFDSSGDKPVDRYQAKQVVYKNYDTDEVTVASSYEDAAAATGLKYATIRFRVIQFRNKGKTDPLGRYFFQDLSDNLQWPEFTKEQLEESIKRFERH